MDTLQEQRQLRFSIIATFIVGATGPMDEKLRRPFIDWIHTAFAQGDVVRGFTKWDYQPGSIHGVPDSFARAYSIIAAGCGSWTMTKS